MRRAARPNCHTFTLSHLEPGRAPTGSVPTAARPHCILRARDLRMLAPEGPRYVPFTTTGTVFKRLEGEISHTQVKTKRFGLSADTGDMQKNCFYLHMHLECSIIIIIINFESILGHFTGFTAAFV